MEHSEELNNSLSERDFIHTVLAAASQIFTTREKKYLEKTRLVKLVAFTADRLDFPLTRGWFRYGIYAPGPSLIISSLLENHGSFERFPDFRTPSEDKMWNQIKNAVVSLKPYFLKRPGDFDRWIHEEMPPPQYKAFYKYEPLFYKRLIRIQNNISKNTQFKAEQSDLSDIITNLGHSIEYVEDREVLDLFYEYVDFWELLVLRIQKRGTTPQMKPIVSELIRIYEEFLRPALSPYEKTLQGINAEQERESFRRKIRTGLGKFKKDLEFYRDMARSASLTATLDEISEDLREKTAFWDKERKDAFKKTLLECMGGLPDGDSSGHRGHHRVRVGRS